MKKCTKTGGITLIALVVTIVILLILTGVAISSLTENGLLEQVKLAKEKQDNAQQSENTILVDYEDKIVSASRDNNIKNDLNIIVTNETSIYASIKVEVQEIFENAVYIYTVNDEIKAHLDINSTVIENLEFQKSYNIVVIIVEGNGNIHKGTAEITTKKPNIDVFGKISDNEKTLENFGITYSYTGSAQTLHQELYKLGMGSSSGIHTNVFTVTIDYQTLLSQLENKKFTGIYGQFYQRGTTSNSSYTSWAYSEIIVTYEDDTTSSVTTEKTSAKNVTSLEEPFATVKFEEGKNVCTIQMIVRMYDSNYGSAEGYIEYIGLIP